MRVGISGHQRLRESDAWEWVRQKMREYLIALPAPVVGITSLAIGADTVFATIVLDLGGFLEVVVPFPDYEQKFESEDETETYFRLTARASKVEVLQRHGTDEQAYYAAGKRVADLSELMMLVWDGKPAAGLGGTGDIADYASRSQKSVIHLNPYTRTVEQ